MGLQANLDTNFEVEQLETLGMLASGIAHDFNNLLTSIVGQTSLALLMLPPEDSARNHLEKALHAAEVAAGLSQQLLNYAGNRNTQIEAVNLNELISDNFSLYNLLFLHAGCIQLDLAPHVPCVEIRPIHVQQILMNLIINAAEAMDGHIEIVKIRTGVEERVVESERVSKNGRKQPKKTFAYIQVQDSGHGMTQEIISQIFDPFFTTKANGTGIGLSTIKEIVSHYKGVVRVESRVNVGTTFTVYFPTATTKASLPHSQLKRLPN